MIVATALVWASSLSAQGGEPIDREALVRRHNPAVDRFDPLGPLTVGNGRFAFTADATGLQTFPEAYAKGIPPATLSYWGWHTIPSPTPYELKDAVANYDTYGRQVPYVSVKGTPASNWLRANPHRLHLGRIGLVLTRPDGTPALSSDVTAVRQSLDLWTGLLSSSFDFAGSTVTVETACHGEQDTLGVRIASPLAREGRVAVGFEFPYGSENWGPDPADWTKPDRHETVSVGTSSKRVDWESRLDNTRYFVSVARQRYVCRSFYRVKHLHAVI